MASSTPITAGPPGAQALQPAEPAGGLRRAWPGWLLAVGAAIVLLTSAAIAIRLEHQRMREGLRIEAVARLRAGEAERWLGEREAQVRFIAASPLIADLYRRWRGGDLASRDLLMAHLQAYAQSGGAAAVQVLDEHGVGLARADAAAMPLPAWLQARVLQALASGEPEFAALHVDPGPPARTRLDAVAPLGLAGKPASGAVLLQTDPEAALLPMLQAWPYPSVTGTLALLRRAGDQVVGLRATEAGPLTAPDLLAAQVLRGAAPSGATIDALDFRGVPVLGALIPLTHAGAGWYLLAQVDRAEVRAQAWRDASWIAAVGALALLTAIVIAHRSRDRHALRAALRAQATQDGRMRELELLDAIIRSSTDVIFAKDAEGRYLWRNRAAAGEENDARGTLVGRDDTELFAAGEAATLRANDARVLAEDRVITFEEVLTLGRGPTTFLATKGPLHDARGQVIGLYGISRDITERRRIETAVAASELRLSLALTAAHMGVWEWDVRTDQVIWSPQVWGIVGQTPPEPGASTVHLTDFTRSIHPDDAERVMATTRLAMAAGGPYSDRFRIVLPDGSQRWLANLGLAEHDDRGQPARVVGIVQDVSEAVRVEAELTHHQARLEARVAERTADLNRSNQALAQAEHFFHAMADNVPGMMLYWNRDLRCEFANASTRAWFDKTPEQMIGITPLELLGPAQFERDAAHARAALAGEPRHVEGPFVGCDGRQFHALAHYIPDVQGGEVLGCFVMVHDVSSLKQAEMRLRELNDQLLESRDKAEAANRAKSVFLANMSHEIRTPMNAIIGLAHLMEGDATQPAQRERLGKVSDAAHHLLDIINDVLDLSKIEAGKLQLEQTDFDLHALLARCVALVSDRAREQGLALLLQTDHLPRWLHGDPTRLSQALLNLLSNAVKFTPRGTITVEGSVIDSAAPRLHLRFEVRDTGIGIAADQLGGLFHAFAQGDSSTTRRYGGSGLGLVITRQLARLMGGDAGVDSEAGIGSRFWFSARLQAASAGGRAGAGTAASRGADPRGRQYAGMQRARDELRVRHAGARVLLAEDNAVNQEVATEMLRSAGLEVDVAETGVQALAMARRGSYALILMDVQMPEMNGMQATRAIRALPDAVPILAMTANAFGEDRIECLAAGMNDHVAKPVDPQGLFETLLRWLPGERA